MKIAYHAKQMAKCRDGIRRSRAIWVRNTREQLRDTSIPDVLRWYPDGQAGSYLKSEYKFMLRFDDVECEILFRGLDDSDDVRRLLSLQASFGVLDEFREINPDIFNALQGRLGRYPSKLDNAVGCVTDGGKSNAHIWGMTNPPDMDTFWETFLSDPPANAEVFFQPSGLSPEADWLEFLPDGYYDNLAEGKSEDWVDVYIHAKFGKSLSGQPVFRSFSRDMHVSKETLKPVNSSNPLIIGVDAGLTPAAVLTQVLWDGRLLVYDALVSDGMGALRFVREKLKPLLANKFPGHRSIIIIDPAAFQRAQTDERTVADIYKSEGFLVKPAKTNAITARISAVDKFLTRIVDGKAGVLICPEGAAPLVQALAGRYRYKINTKGEREETPEKSHPWSDVCFKAGTPIATPDGDRPIESLKVGDFVYTHDGVDRVVATGFRDGVALIELTLSDGSTIVCTPDHPFAVNSHTCFLRADALSYAHRLVSIGDNKWVSGQNRIQQNASLNKTVGTVASCLVPPHGGLPKGKENTVPEGAIALDHGAQMGLNTMACGLLKLRPTTIIGIKLQIKAVYLSIITFGQKTLGRFLKGMLSTTKTMILPIMRSKIWSWFWQKSIVGTIHKNVFWKGHLTLTRLWRKLEKRQKHGINPQKGESGIEKTLPNHNQKLSMSVQSVEKATIGLSVPTNGTTAPLCVIKSSYVGSGRVFNLTTERTHLYYAGGVLVHNCDAFEYSCLHADGGEGRGNLLAENTARTVAPVNFVYS